MGGNIAATALGCGMYLLQVGEYESVGQRAAGSTSRSDRGVWLGLAWPVFLHQGIFCVPRLISQKTQLSLFWL